MTVYDCTMFLNENDLFEIRLNQHWNFVDKFVVIEAKQTHTGLAKPLNFDHARFKNYADKIVYIVIEDFEKEIAKYPELDCQIARKLHGNGHAWVRDHFQINYVYKVLQDLGAKDDDIIFVSSCDEIICEESFERALAVFEDKETLYTGYDWVHKQPLIEGIRPCFGFHLYFYVYKFNLLRWRPDHHVAALITEFVNFKKVLPGTLRSLSLSTHYHVEEGGWHFSYADNGDGEMVVNKLKSWAHSHDLWIGGGTRADVKSKEEALSKLGMEHPGELVPVDYSTHPKYLVDNIDKFQSYILKV